MQEKEILCTMALTRVSYSSLAGLLQLYRTAGSAARIVEYCNDIRELIPHAHPRLVEALRLITGEPMRRAEVEYKYNQDHNIEMLCYNDERYPARLRECDDAPVILYYRGVADLNQRHVINIIGTRNCTTYGKDLIRRLCEDMRLLCPQLLIVSGLAYGIDICAHREALRCGYDTVGVVAHGLDDLYPSLHRDTANEMVTHGGLLSEFMTQTEPEKRNFVQRNRIVAGVSDACLVVESAAKGGALITAGISRSYNRDVFAFPGAVGAPRSEGCNNLIRDNKATLVTCAEDLTNAMGWNENTLLQPATKDGIERELFPTLTPEEQQVVSTLQKNNDLQINMLSVQANIPIQKINATLFGLEMKGVIKTLAGGMYHLIV